MQDRRKRGQRALGPYQRPSGRWYIILVTPGGPGESNSRVARGCSSRAAGARAVAEINASLAAEDHDTDSAREGYIEFLARKCTKRISRDTTAWALAKFWPEPIPLWSLTTPRLRQRYQELTATLSVDSHRNILAQCKSMLRWCVDQGWLRANPLEPVRGIGKRRRRKPQLRIADLRMWYAHALELARAGDVGAIAALVALLLGLRASEIIALRAGDLDREDEPCDVLWIRDSKTEAGRRCLSVPAELRQLLAALADGQPREAQIFGRHWRDWVRKRVARICDSAGVPRVTAHAMRGALATLALERGMAGHAVAATLGHESERTTRGAYAAPGAGDRAQIDRGKQRLTGRHGEG